MAPVEVSEGEPVIAETVAGEEVLSEENTATPEGIATEAEKAKEKERSRRRGRGRGRKGSRRDDPREAAKADFNEEKETTIAETITTEPEGEDDGDTEDVSGWEVPSWNELIAALYRPDR